MSEGDVNLKGPGLPGQAQVGVALLRELESRGGSARRPDLLEPIATKMGVTPEQLSARTPGDRSSWQARVNFTRLYLANAGLLHSVERGVWAITPAGQEVLASTDPLAAIKTAHKAYRKIKGPRRRRARKEVPEERATSRLRVPAEVASIISHLQTSERDAAHSSRFEEAIAEAFGYLGFAAAHIGGAGDTDVFLAAHYTADPYSVVVDAKTTSHPRISDGQVQWYHIEQHRNDRQATYAAIVACGFPGGLLAKQAAEYKVALVTTEQLRQVLEWHAVTPLGLQQLRPLFEPGEGALSGLAEIEKTHSRRIRSRRILGAVVGSMAQYQEAGQNVVSPQTLEGYLFARASEFDVTPAPSATEVRAAVELLANPILGVLEDQGDNSYALTMAPETAADLFRQAVLMPEAQGEEPDVAVTE